MTNKKADWIFEVFKLNDLGVLEELKQPLIDQPSFGL